MKAVPQENANTLTPVRILHKIKILRFTRSDRTNHPVSRDGCHPSFSKEGSLCCLPEGFVKGDPDAGGEVEASYFGIGHGDGQAAIPVRF